MYDIDIYYPTAGVDRKVNLARLDVMSKYKRNWNGYGAEPFRPEVIEAGRKALENCTVEPEIFPLASGRIQFEWGEDGKYYVELIVDDQYYWDIWSEDNTFPEGAKVRAKYALHTVERYIKDHED